MLPSFARETISVRRAAATVQRGSTVRDWANETTHNVAGCHVQPESTSSDYGDRANIIQTFMLYAPVNADVKKGDRIECSAGTFDVVGAPAKWYSPTGSQDHMEVRMTSWEG